MLFAYFDDSSDDRRERYVAAGGLIGSEEQWDFFDVLWADAIRDLELPFRSTECECNQGQFKTWSKEQCNALMEKLVTLLLKSKLMGFASVVPVADFTRIFPSLTSHDAYYLAVRHTIINMATIADRTRNHVKLCFEDSQSTSAGVRKLYDELKAEKNWGPSVYLLGFSIRNKSLLQLQAADFVAREAFKYFDNKGARRTRIPVRRMADRFNFKLWNLETLKYLQDNGGPECIETLITWGQKEQPPQMQSFYKRF